MDGKFEGNVVLPWLGDAYKTGPTLFSGLRVLVLGESSHDANPANFGKSPQDAIQRAVQEFLAGSAYRLHTVLTTLLSGKSDIAQVSQKEREVIWSNIAFYNYLDPILAVAGRDRPPAAAFAAAHDTFFKKLRIVRPHAILVCGAETSGWLANSLGLPKPWTQTHYRVPLDGPEAGGEYAWAVKVQHPSAAFAYEKERAKLEKLLALAKQAQSSSSDRRYEA